jgi:transposase
LIVTALFDRHRNLLLAAFASRLLSCAIVAPVGRHGVEESLNVVADPSEKWMPEVARVCLAAFGARRVPPIA